MTMFWINLCAFVSISAAMGTLPAWAGVVCAAAWGFMVCNEKWKAGVRK